MGFLSNILSQTNRSIQTSQISMDDIAIVLRDKIILPTTILRSTTYVGETKEKRVQNNLLAQLKERYGQSNVNTEFSVGGHWGMKCDLDLFHGKIGIELKVAEQLKSASNVERLIGQVVYYMKKQYGNNLIVFIAGKPKEYDASMQELEEIINSLGAKFIYKEI